MRRPVRVRFCFVFLVVGCGAQTGLDVPLHHDAGPDAHFVYDAAIDVPEEPDAEFPPLDAAKHDVDITGCPALTYVYAVATSDELLRFDPPSATFTSVGHISCNAGGSHPFSMAVDRKGTAYVEYDNGMIFAVSTIDASCQSTKYVANQLPPFSNFGMGYATIGFGPDEQLFVAADAPGTLGQLDTLNDLKVLPVAMIKPDISWAELTGTGDGRLYAFYGASTDSETYVAELDKATGAILGQDLLPDVHRGTGWAFAYWGGDFWIFTTPNPQTTWKYDPATKEATVVAHYGAPIVGAGVSTCAPQ